MGIETIALLGLGAAGSVLQASAAGQQAEASAAASEATAAALARKAGEERAASQRESITRGKQADLALSKLQASAAASGGGATDPTVLQLMGDIAGQGQYNSLSALYEGQSKPAGLETQADIDVDKAKRTRAAIPALVGGTLLTGVSSFASGARGLKFT